MKSVFLLWCRWLFYRYLVGRRTWQYWACFSPVAMLVLQDRWARREMARLSNRDQRRTTYPNEFFDHRRLNQSSFIQANGCFIEINCLPKQKDELDWASMDDCLTYLTFSRSCLTRRTFTSASSRARQISPNASPNTCSLIIVALLRFLNADDSRRPRSARTIRMSFSRRDNQTNWCKCVDWRRTIPRKDRQVNIRFVQKWEKSFNEK